MLTTKQKELLKQMHTIGYTTSKYARKIYNTYAGFYRTIDHLKDAGLIKEYVGLFGVRYFYLSDTGKKILKDLNIL